jgi:hypothetical protein
MSGTDSGAYAFRVRCGCGFQRVIHEGTHIESRGERAAMIASHHEAICDSQSKLSPKLVWTDPETGAVIGSGDLPHRGNTPREKRP